MTTPLSTCAISLLKIGARAPCKCCHRGTQKSSGLPSTCRWHGIDGMAPTAWHRRHGRHGMAGMASTAWHRRHGTDGMAPTVWHRRHAGLLFGLWSQAVRSPSSTSRSPAPPVWNGAVRVGQTVLFHKHRFRFWSGVCEARHFWAVQCRAAVIWPGRGATLLPCCFSIAAALCRCDIARQCNAVLL